MLPELSARQSVNIETHFATTSLPTSSLLPLLLLAIVNFALTQSWNVDRPRANWVDACRMPAVVAAADPVDAVANSGYEMNPYEAAPNTPGRVIGDANWWVCSRRMSCLLSPSCCPWDTLWINRLTYRIQRIIECT